MFINIHRQARISKRTRQNEHSTYATRGVADCLAVYIANTTKQYFDSFNFLKSFHL